MKSFFTRMVLGLIFFSALSSSDALARDLHGRVGLGYNAQFANVTAPGGVPGIAVKYGFARDLAIEGIAAASTGTPSNSAFGAKFYKNLFFETNLNFYAMAGLAFVSAGTSGEDIIAGFGAEFFVPGVDSLGISMETGGRFTNISGSFAFQTMGVSFLNAGMRFYF